VKFIISRDPKGHFRFVPLQSDLGIRLLKSYGIPFPEIDSIVYLDSETWSIESSAALLIARQLRWPWSLLYGFVVIPRPIRDAVYRWVARNRHRWFGKSESCMVPKPEWRDRFL